MTPPKKPTTGAAEAAEAPRFQPHPDDVTDVAEGIAEAERGEGVVLSPEQAEAYCRWLETGEGPCPIPGEPST